MKKLALILVALFTTSLMFSQAGEGENSGELNGNGQDKDCIGCHVDELHPQQVHGITENESWIEQDGTNNHAKVYQEGDLNFSNIYQMGDENHSKVTQMGSGNMAFVDQRGDRNHGSINQEGTGNYADQRVGVGFAENNHATIEQEGYFNRAFQLQYWDKNKAKITQFNDESEGHGKYNYAYQEQRTGMNWKQGSDAEIYQDGQKNQASQQQFGSNNDAFATQYGWHNRSVEYQTSVAGGDLTNISIVLQDGKNNKSCVYQTATEYSNFSDVNQLGDNNHAKVQQFGTSPIF